MAGVANSGAGPVLFADRGAFEYRTSPSGVRPVARLGVAPMTGSDPLTVSASGSASTDDVGIVAYRFDFGDGVTADWQLDPATTHTYEAGEWPLELVVIDASGRTDSTVRTVSVSPGPGRPPILNAPDRATVNENLSVVFGVAAFDPDGDPITSLVADLSGLPAGHKARFTPGPENTTGTLSWTTTYAQAGTYTVTFRAANSMSGVATTRITVANVDRSPVVTAPAVVRARVGREVVIEVVAGDPDADAIGSLVADLTRLPPGNNASFTTNDARTGGTFRWTPGATGSGTFGIVFSASNNLSGTATTVLDVRRTPDSMSEPGDPSSDPFPAVLQLSPGYPNPAGREITFALDLPRDARVSWEIFDALGRRVWRRDRELRAGRYALGWDGTNAAGAGRRGRLRRPHPRRRFLPEAAPPPRSRAPGTPAHDRICSRRAPIRNDD